MGDECNPVIMGCDCAVLVVQLIPEPTWKRFFIVPHQNIVQKHPRRWLRRYSSRLVQYPRTIHNLISALQRTVSQNTHIKCSLLLGGRAIIGHCSVLLRPGSTAYADAATWLRTERKNQVRFTPVVQAFQHEPNFGCEESFQKE